MTFREMLIGLFNVDFLAPEELGTICKAGEMYARGCLKQQADLQAELERVKGLVFEAFDEGLMTVLNRVNSALAWQAFCKENNI